MFNWYLLYTKPKSEDLLADKLAEKGFEVLNPRLVERKYVRRKLTDVVSPLFPCYIFVRFDILKSFRLIKYTRGVRRVVGTGDFPSVVPDEIVEAIRARTIDGPVTIKPRSFAPGEEVLIKGGQLEGLTAVFEKELSGLERVSVLLKAVNARVVVSRALLAKA